MFPKRKHRWTTCKWKMPNITNHQGNKVQNKNEISSHTCQNDFNIKNIITNDGEDMEKRETSYPACGSVNWHSYCGKQYGNFSKSKSRTTIFLGMYLKKSKNTDSKRYICTPMFREALFTIAEVCFQHKCPSTDEWIKM